MLDKILLNIAEWCINHASIKRSCLVTTLKKYPLCAILTALKELNKIEEKDVEIILKGIDN